MKRIDKLLIANRGEIAVRIIRTAQSMGIHTIAIFSEQDRHALHTRMADDCRPLGKGNLDQTYLDIEKIIGIAKQSQADAIHPGYGFLSENPQFAQKCIENQILFVGPSPETIRLMGNKSEAADFVSALGIPLPGVKKGNPSELYNRLLEEDLPVMIKAAAGGGGKGMRVVRTKDRLQEALYATAPEAQSYFGNGSVYVEKFIENPKHVEIQVLGDHYGNFIHLFERECSVQRRHQKIIEESPSPALDEKTRNKMGEAAIKIAKASGYSGAGTVEFLVDGGKNFYFLEMNTRIQVEHPVTEMVTGMDLVREQIRIARDLPLHWEQHDIKIRGHAVEVRVYAEDPVNHFLPSPGKIHQLIFPEMKGVRIDAGVSENEEISPDYDPLIAKIIVWKKTREAALDHLRKALNQTIITGIRHSITYLKEILCNKKFTDNQFTTGFIENNHRKILQNIVDQRQQIDHRYLIAAYIFLQSIKRIAVKEGDQVKDGQAIMETCSVQNRSE